MTENEAIIFFNDFIETLKINGEEQALKNDYCKSANIAIKAIEKQIPKKLEIGNDNGKERKCCGNCRCFILPASKYCSKCGQKLSWESDTD